MSGGRGVWSGYRGGGDGGGRGGRGRACGGRGGHHDPAGREAAGRGTHGGLGRRGVYWGRVEAVERASHPGVLATPTPTPARGGELRTVGERAGHVQAHVLLHLALEFHAVVLRGEERGLADAELPHAAGDAADHVDDASLGGTAVLVGQLDPLPAVVVVGGVVVGEAPLPAEGGAEGGVGVERVAHDVLVRVAVGVGRGCVGGIAGAALLEALAGGSEGGGRRGLGAEGAVVGGVGGERGGDRGQEGAGHGGEGRGWVGGGGGGDSGGGGGGAGVGERASGLRCGCGG